MAWIPSHQEIRDHPKTLRFARKLGVSVPTAVGHLHLVWHWALGLAPDGDLSKFDAEDIAIGAMWDGDPEVFVDALMKCGPGGAAGFLDVDMRLHDWDAHGGRYGRRVDAAKKAAAARWNPPSECEGNANAMQPHGERSAQRNAEERRGEEKETCAPPALVSVPSVPDSLFDDWWQAYPRKLVKKEALKAWNQMTKGTDASVIVAGLAPWNAYWTRTGTGMEHIPHPATWLRQERWNDAPTSGPTRRAPVVGPGGALMAPGVEF